MLRAIIKRSTGRAILGVVLTLSLWGCGGSNPWETVYPAGGTVVYNGKPVADAEIALFPEDPAAPVTVRPRAKSAPNGTFALWTYDFADGAPAGRYKATVVRHEVVVSNGAVGAKPNDLPKKYSNVQTTDLIIEIAQQGNEIPTLELQ